MVNMPLTKKICDKPKPYLPDDYRKTLSALFAYRNNMLHRDSERGVRRRE